ncbi:hypothetical protein HHK36_000282 [Tetracentron sinense]|uniref:Transcriptional regulator SLK2 n=1 Tax=Tetracentron sinense TaxID=13715 RepID=A0A835DQN2_TETSI|nr:hypothetical protein HHK36_000282 [Tetracentron sinense]
MLLDLNRSVTRRTGELVGDNGGKPSVDLAGEDGRLGERKDDDGPLSSELKGAGAGSNSPEMRVLLPPTPTVKANSLPVKVMLPGVVGLPSQPLALVMSCPTTSSPPSSNLSPSPASSPAMDGATLSPAQPAIDPPIDLICLPSQEPQESTSHANDEAEPTVVPSNTTHPMMTRSRDGTRRLKAWHATRHPVSSALLSQHSSILFVPQQANLVAHWLAQKALAESLTLFSSLDGDTWDSENGFDRQSKPYLFAASVERFHRVVGSFAIGKIRPGSSHQSVMPPAAKSRVAGGPAQSSSSGIFFQGDEQSQAAMSPNLNPSFGNSSTCIPGMECSSIGPASRDMNRTTNSGPSVAASSLVTDANSSLSGGPHLQRSVSINMESYLRPPASPMSFSSNNISIPVSSVIDGTSVIQQSSHQGQSSQQGASNATHYPASQIGPYSVVQESDTLSRMQKKPRLDIRQEDILQQQLIQQLLQRQDSMQLQGHNPQLQALIQHQRLRHQQQQQILQSMPQMPRTHLQQQQQQQHQQHLQQQQLRHHLQQQGMQQVSAMKNQYGSGVCARRLMQYLYHQRHRPPDNSIGYWRKFVTEYYAPRAKKRWCLSLYDNNVGHHSLGALPQAVMDAWQCDICGSKSGRGFEETFEVLPRLSKLNFDTGVIDELLFVELPHEYRFPSGIMVLEYGKAVQESVYEQIRVVREGQLRITFTHDLKISSWEFCACRHEEFLPRRLVTQQVNQLVQVAQKYQSTVNESGSDGVSPQELQTFCNMFLTAGRELVKNLELQSLNDLGFSKRYVRSLQISEVASSMTDLIDFSCEHNIEPIESLKKYPRQATTAKIQMQKMLEMEQLVSAQGLPTDRNALNKLMASNPDLRNHMNNNHHMVSSGIVNGSAQSTVALTNYRNFLRQNSINSNANKLQQEASCSFQNSNQNRSSPFQEHGSLTQGSMKNFPVNGFSSQQKQQQHSLNANSLLQSHPQSSHGSQNSQQHMIQQLMQEMMGNSGEEGVKQHSLGSQNANGSVGEDFFSGINGIAGGGLPVRAGGTGVLGNGLGFGSSTSAGAAAIVPDTIVGITPNKTSNFKPSSRNSSAIGGKNSFNQRAPDEITENGVLNTDPEDMDYGWKT